MDDAQKQKAIEQGQAITELKRSEGWSILEDRIKAEIDSSVADMRRLEIEGKPLEVIGSEYVSHIKLIDGLSKIFEILEEIESRKAEALENDE